MVLTQVLHCLLIPLAFLVSLCEHIAAAAASDDHERDDDERDEEPTTPSAHEFARRKPSDRRHRGRSEWGADGRRRREVRRQRRWH